MSVTSERVRALIAQEAADWFIANRAGLTARELNTFAAWLKASPVHVEEYLAMSVIARDLPEAREGSEVSLDVLVNRARLEEDNPPRSLLLRSIRGLAGSFRMDAIQPRSRW